MPRHRLSTRSGSIMVTLGLELVPNPDMELDSNWSNLATPTSNARSNEQRVSGTYSRKFVGDSANDGIISDAFATDVNSLYCKRCFIYSNITSVRLGHYEGSGAGSGGQTQFTVVASQWTDISLVYINNDAGALAQLYVNVPSAGTVYVDDASVKKLTPSLG